MEIGQQTLHHGKTKTRLNHQIDRTAKGLQLPAMERRHPFEAAHAGGAHSNHSPAALAAGGNGLHQGLTHLHPFAVQLQLAEVFGFDRPKRAQAHMQGDAGPLDAFLCQGRQ